MRDILPLSQTSIICQLCRHREDLFRCYPLLLLLADFLLLSQASHIEIYCSSLETRHNLEIRNTHDSLQQTQVHTTRDIVIRSRKTWTIGTCLYQKNKLSVFGFPLQKFLGMREIFFSLQVRARNCSNASLSR